MYMRLYQDIYIYIYICMYVCMYAYEILSRALGNNGDRWYKEPKPRTRLAQSTYKSVGKCRGRKGDELKVISAMLGQRDMR